MASNRNRTAGNNFERLIVRELKELGYDDVVTSRSESKNMDDRGVDIFGPDFPYYIQCKNSKTYQKLHDLITSEKLPKDKPTVVFQRKTRKANTKFVTEGDYVSMKKEDFYELLKKIK
jgi:Holliday junction resolvase